jgi:YVTN family beta-propeller protein
LGRARRGGGRRRLGAPVTNSGSSNVSVIAGRTVVATVTVGLNPKGLAITPDGLHAYVVNKGSNNVSVIATATNTVVATVTVGLKPTGVAVAPGGTRLCDECQRRHCLGD